MNNPSEASWVVFCLQMLNTYEPQFLYIPITFTYPSHTFSKITGYMHEQYRRVLYSATIVTYRGGERKPSCTHHTSHVHMADSRVVPRSL